MTLRPTWRPAPHWVSSFVRAVRQKLTAHGFHARLLPRSLGTQGFCPTAPPLCAAGVACVHWLRALRRSHCLSAGHVLRQTDTSHHILPQAMCAALWSTACDFLLLLPAHGNVAVPLPRTAWAPINKTCPAPAPSAQGKQFTLAPLGSGAA